MKKQYYISEGTPFRYYITLYHDGAEIITTKKWAGDEVNEYLECIESHGYTRGYTKADVDRAEERFKYLRDNLIEGM